MRWGFTSLVLKNKGCMDVLVRGILWIGGKLGWLAGAWVVVQLTSGDSEVAAGAAMSWGKGKRKKSLAFCFVLND